MATAWLIEFQSVFLDFKTVIKGPSSKRQPREEAEGAAGTEGEWHLSTGSGEPQEATARIRGHRVAIGGLCPSVLQTASWEARATAQLEGICLV